MDHGENRLDVRIGVKAENRNLSEAKAAETIRRDDKAAYGIVSATRQMG
jgi:hypothetical protein